MSDLPSLVGDQMETLLDSLRFDERRRRGRTRCALCGATNRTTFSYREDGRWHCFRCGAGGAHVRLTMDALGLGYRYALRHLRDLGLPVPDSQTDASANHPPSTAHPWPPSPREMRQMDRDLSAAYAEIELCLAGSLRQRWVEVDRKVRAAGVDPEHVTPADFEDGAKLAALDDYYRVIDRLDLDEQYLEQIAHRRRNT